MKKCCIIGGTGFIGGSVVQELLKTDRKITVIGRHKYIGFSNSLVNYIFGDCLDADFMKQYLFNYDEVIILSDFLDIYKQSIEIFKKKVKNLFYHLIKVNINKILIASSGGAVYGNSEILPIKEFFSKKPISDYGKAKYLLEKIGFFFYSQYNLPIIFIRPSNVYGANQVPFTGQGFISTSLFSVKLHKKIDIYGTEGTVRDYIYIDDVVTAIIKLLNSGKMGEAYNIGTGIGLNNFEIINIIQNVTLNKNILTNVKNSRSMDVRANVLDCTKIFKDVGWSPKVLIADGILKFWDSLPTTSRNNHTIWEC